MQFRSALLIAILAGAAALEVTPIDKVITLIDGLKNEVQADGKSEAKAYEKFACFCKDKTGTKSKSVQSGTKKIGVLSADIADKTQEQRDDSSELLKRKGNQEDLSTKLDDENARCAKKKAEYEAEAADLSKAIQGLKDAIKAMKTSKPSLLAIRKTLGSTLAMAEAMSLLTTPKHKAAAAFIQQSSNVDPSDPEYNFHSNDIIDVCEKLLVDYKSTKKDLDEEWAKTKKGCAEMKASLKKQLSTNKAAMDSLVKSIAKLRKEIAQHREDLLNSQDLLKDDEQYLKDLQVRCEDRANDYDQRSVMRGDELSALVGALKVLTGTVKVKGDIANERALLIQNASVAAKPSAKKTVPVAAKSTAKAAPVVAKVKTEVAKGTSKSISFLQEISHSSSFLGSKVSKQERKSAALDVLRKEGQRLDSLVLTSLAEKVAAPRFDSAPATDPFKKIKGLIQRLIERLLEESKNEATKKGFCDTELGKARKDRDFRFQDANDLSADLQGLEAKRDALTQEIKTLKKDIKAETLALKEATTERAEEKKANLLTIKTAKEGLEGLNEALLILRSFYKQAAKASLLQASPVDEDTSGPGFDGNYKGKQSGMKAVFALLETIQSDFDRTLRSTERSEAASHRDYVEFQQTADSSIAGKSTKQQLDEEDLKTTQTSLKTKMDDLQTAMDLCDKALQELENLKPQCTDSGMSYSERVKKREEEMEALGKALCILDEDKVEAECRKDSRR